MGAIDEFREASQWARDRIDEGNPVLVVTHNDADGLTSGTIAHLALRRAGCPVQTRGIKQLEEPIVKELAKEKRPAIVFTDMGSGQLSAIEEYLSRDTHVLVLDHHEPEMTEEDGVVHLNAHNLGMDGAREISGAGMAYLFAKTLDDRNTDLATLAVIGALGDNQGAPGYMRGENVNILKDAQEAGMLRVEKDLRLFGRQTRPLYKAIEYTTEPFIPGLSGSESRCVQFLKDLDIPVKRDDRYVMLADLTPEERQRLTTALILKMIEYRVPQKVAEGIVGEVYTLVKEEKRTPLRDAREFATLLNACGKNEKYGLGIAICMGDRGASLEGALEMLKEHKGQLVSYYNWLSENQDRIKQRETLYHFHAGTEIHEAIIGTVAGMLLGSRTLDPILPVIAFIETPEGKIKVSARGTRDLVEKGLNLGRVMDYAAGRAGGEGGGHDIAAGAYIPKGREEEFLEYAQQEIRRQTGEDGS
jgi:RecJ-like exonuclease